MRILDRLTSILDAVVDQSEPATPASVARRVDLPLPTVSRLMRQLAKARFLEADERTNIFLLGSRILELGYAARPTRMVGSIVPEMERIRDATGETVSLHVRSDDKRVCVAEVQSFNSVRRVVPVGLIVPLHFGATGQVLLAALSPAALAGYVRAHVKDASAARTLVTIVETVRSRGWAMAVDSWVEGLSGLAVPVSDGEQIVASLAISGPSTRWTPEAMQRRLDVVLAGARAATQRLSGRTSEIDATPRPRL
ncbi:MAG: IclR family transcriptional regulator, partial [Rhizobiales bacterium]|nr:IclR family transcriptional regulator [Hyphomicrobiales bacterium]